MTKIRVDNKDFNSAKQKLKQFSDSLPENQSLKSFEELTFFGMLTKNVTGKDMNDFVKGIQKILISGNKTTKNIIAEFKVIYETFEALDQNYIQAILVAIENSENANDEALKASNEANEAQKDIKRTIGALKLTVEKLYQFKNESAEAMDLLKYKIDAFQSTIDQSLHNLQRIDALKVQLEEHKHLNDIDTIWSDVQLNKEELSKVNTSLNLLSIKSNELDNQLSEKIQAFHDGLEYKTKQLNNKLKMAYVFGAGMIAILTVQTILNLLRVI